MRYLLAIIFCFLCFDVFSQPQCFDEAARFKGDFEYDKALAVLSETESRNDELLRYLARIACLNAEEDESLSLFNALSKKEWQDYFYIGLIKESRKDYAGAVAAYQDSLHMFQSPVVLYRLAKIHYQRLDFKNASIYFARVVEMDKSMRLAYYYLGECYSKLEDYRKSHGYLQQALNFYPKKDNISKGLAESKQKLGNKFFVDEHKEKEDRRKEFKLPFYSSEQNAPWIRVGIAKNISQVTFKSGESFNASDGKAKFCGQGDKFYVIEWIKGVFVLKDYKTGKTLRSFSRNLTISSRNRPFYIFDVMVGSGNFWHRQMDMILRGKLELADNKTSMTLINVLTVEDYVCGVLPAEISSDSSMGALKAQAVAARTIALRNFGRHKKEGFDVCADVHCQAYRGMLVETAVTNSAVKDTRGQILVYNDKPIEAYYHSNCGGCLRDSVFGENVSFLKAKGDCRDACFDPGHYAKDMWFFTTPENNFSFRDRSNYRWQRVYDAQDLLFLTSHRIDQFKIKLEDEGFCGHYGKVTIDYAGDRVVLNKDLDIRNYFDNLRSSAFRMEIKYTKDKVPQFIILWGAGFGHGAGMSQEGAMTMGEQGYGVEDILKHYYQGAKIKKAY